MDKSKLNPLVDADGLIYACAFAADTEAKKEWGSEGYLENDYQSWALANIKKTLTNLFENVFTNAEWHRIFLGGDTNYRDTIATTLPQVHEGWKYKGNRDKLHKPKYFAESREYLVTRWGATIVDGRESDDEVSIIQFSHPDRSTCIVSGDKDLFNTPGWSYNRKKEKFTYTSLKEANINFRLQCLMGDSTDNIPGLKDIGPKRAQKVINDCQFNLEAIDRKTLQMYQSQYGHKLGEYVMNDNKNLLWIQREDWKGWDGRNLKPKEEQNK